MPARKLWPGAPNPHAEPPGDIPEKDKKDHPEVSICGVTYQWAPGEESGVPPEALEVWKRFLEVNE